MKLNPEVRSSLEANTKYAGVIEKVEERTDPYAYVDLVIRPDGVDYTVRVGFPANLTFLPNGEPGSGLAKLAVRFGYEATAEAEFDTDSLAGKRVEFIAGTPQKTERGEFSRILQETIIPEATKKNRK